MHKKAFGQQASPDPAGEGELTALTKPIAGKKGRSGRYKGGGTEEGSSPYHYFLDSPLLFGL